MINDLKPIFLLADSQLLFYKSENVLFLDRIKNLIKKEANRSEIKAAYIGASNNDNHLFYEIFEIAMQQIDIRNCQMIKSEPDVTANSFLQGADIILLAGGDIYKGWNIIERNGWDQIIAERYSQGAILIGVSAGAVQLGLKAYREDPEGLTKKISFDTLQLVPFIIDVHADDDWIYLINRIKLEGQQKGYGIPYGGGLIYYLDMSVEAIRFSCAEIVLDNKKVMRSIVLPLFKRNEINEN